MASDSSVPLTRDDLSFVGSLKDIQIEHDGYTAAAFGKALGLAHIGVNHETVFPGGQSSRPHAHSKDEEFVFVVEGQPSLWIDGHLIELDEGDAVAFPAGTGIAHCFINNSDASIKLLIVGEHWPDDRVIYPVNPEIRHPRPWANAPTRALGPHDGCPDDVPVSD